MNSKLKVAVGVVGGLFAIAHIGLLGYVIRQPKRTVEVPTINIPHGPYSSYKIEAGKDGYSIEYKANDPALYSILYPSLPASILYEEYGP